MEYSLRDGRTFFQVGRVTSGLKWGAGGGGGGGAEETLYLVSL